MAFQPGVTVPDMLLCALLACTGYAWGRLLRSGLGGAGLILIGVLSAGLLALLILGNLGDGLAPIAVGVIAHLAGSCAALFAPGDDS